MRSAIKPPGDRLQAAAAKLNAIATNMRKPVIIRRAVTVSAIVGTSLTLINQGDLILSGALPPAWKVMLTYLTPYLVSSYSAAAQNT